MLRYKRRKKKKEWTGIRESGRRNGKKIMWKTERKNNSMEIGMKSKTEKLIKKWCRRSIKNNKLQK